MNHKLLLAAFLPVVTAIARKRNPANGKGLITNFPTQLFANREVSARAVWKVGKESREVRIDNWIPGRTPEGARDRSLGRVVWNKYASGDVKNPEAEFWSFLTYLAASIATGVLPSPARPSGESTTKAAILRAMLAGTGVSLESIVLIGKTPEDGTIELTGANHAMRAAIFESAYDSILSGWKDSERKSRGGDKIVDWI